MVQHYRGVNGSRLLLTPNRSLSWQGNVCIWLALCAVSAVIVTGMFLLGAWVVLPFAGLELLAVAAGLYKTARKCRRLEVLRISPENLLLEKGVNRKEAEWNLPRRATRIYLVSSRHPWSPPKLFLMYRETEISLASFLNIEDTRILISILESQGILIERRQPIVGFWF
ncbi:hypothetical protein RE428_12000 [Marinobacter nanhaiticus D15-8W]|uniref:DUF2244 domain-containing protein n=1 Tax=Marinobacter nanhaiticus D15-8W TaxID=626887 RepID=N6WVG8_9GAMM|nr:DUF2244 domain-containing protein [Marinobacter nanhaiticus]ENO12833.1 DUF2244 domain-containing protein [Marinobacter nanhaiticus D15-8W]BES70182.1 hypothetical protein RE428_12000 [Marinobacter nanhaiticus D15-8W]